MAATPVDQVIAEIRSVYGRWHKATTVGEMRRDWDNLFHPRAQAVPSQRCSANGVPAAWITMPGTNRQRAILYLHGGGFRLGSIISHLDLMQRLSRAVDAAVLGIDYRLAPEHHFPAPVEDAISAYRYLLEQGYRSDRIAFAGDSAGGGLVLSTMFAAREAGLPLPGSAVLMSAWADMDARGASYETRAAADPVHSRKMILALARSYLGASGNAHDPLASPINGDMRGLPPMLVQCGDRETGLDDSILLVERARAAGVDARLEIYDGMIHVFQMFAELGETTTAISSAGAFLRDCLSA